MKNVSKNQFSLAEQRLYPYLKLTAERFPRLLATRKIADDGAEYFGAFLPETGVRFLLDFLNKIFRLRSCEIDVDGTFPVPCTQFYRKRCVAPCVASLCSEDEYAAQTALVRSFLQRKSGEIERSFSQAIEALAENLEFEKASEMRDQWLAIEKVFRAKDWNYWLDDAIDTFEVEETENDFFVFLATVRGRKTLGKRVFVFEKNGAANEILPAILPQFYRFHAPKEIRVSHDFADRFALADELSIKFNRKIKISLISADAPKITANRALGRARYEYEFSQIKRTKPLAEVQSELKRLFGLTRKLQRIEGFDVAHISGKDSVAAKSVWENGKFCGKKYSFWFSDQSSELETMRNFIEFHFSRNSADFPDAILIDGGKSHLHAALIGLKNVVDRKFTVVSAVKPPGRHGEISHFLHEDGRRTNFDGDNAAHRILQNLRDEAHNLSNEIHRQRREMAHFYELSTLLPSLAEPERRTLLRAAGSLKKVSELTLNELKEKFSNEKVDAILSDLRKYKSGRAAEVQPLIVPIRFDDENGDAQDLRLLTTYK